MFFGLPNNWQLTISSSILLLEESWCELPLPGPLHPVKFTWWILGGVSHPEANGYIDLFLKLTWLAGKSAHFPNGKSIIFKSCLMCPSGTDIVIPEAWKNSLAEIQLWFFPASCWTAAMGMPFLFTGTGKGSEAAVLAKCRAFFSGNLDSVNWDRLKNLKTKHLKGTPLETKKWCLESTILSFLGRLIRPMFRAQKLFVLG